MSWNAVAVEGKIGFTRRTGLRLFESFGGRPIFNRVERITRPDRTMDLLVCGMNVIHRGGEDGGEARIYGSARADSIV